MKSPRGFLAAIVFLIAMPVAALCQLFFGIGVEIVLHLVLASGFTLISFAVFDFKIPGWITWTGCAGTSALAAIFLLQGASFLIQNDSLTYLAFQVLGQRLEKWLGDLLLFWFAALLLIDSRGKTKILGFVVMSTVVCVEIYSYYLSYLGTSLDAEAPILKILYLLPFVWFLFESKKKKIFSFITGIPA
jgi:hypothetical protein